MLQSGLTPRKMAKSNTNKNNRKDIFQRARHLAVQRDPWSEYRLKGFAIPAHYYFNFMESNDMPSALDPGRRVTYSGYLEELFASDAFNSDSTFRFEALRALRDDMEERGQVPDELVARLAGRISEVYIDLPSDHRVRFRSSSNVEDAIEFNGAGLYDSTSVCALDDLDDDSSGPSHCDATRTRERGIVRGLRRVWSSLWNFRAYEERAFYGIDQSKAAMGILSNKAFVQERANGVAFTGNPGNPLDRRYVVTVQPGEASVVSPDPGVLPEKDVLEMADGDVVHIIRAVPSSLVPDGEFVLSDEELRELGRLMWHIDHNFPIETGNHPRADVLLDLEFKIESSGELAVKQVRPFLLTNPAPPALTFDLQIPDGTVACGAFGQGRRPRREYELKSTLHFAPGGHVLRASVDTSTATIIRELVIGPGRDLAAPDGPGLFRLEKVPAGAGTVNYHFSYEQAFVLPGGERVDLTISEISFEARDGVPVEPALVLDSGALTDRISMTTSFRRDGGIVDIFYTSCGHETLPRWEIHAELADGNSLFFEERYRPELTRDFGPASVVRAELVLGAQRHVVRDYWNLIYSATRHNLHAVYWAVLDPPVTVPGIDKPVRAVELAAPIPTDNIFDAKANYLGAARRSSAGPTRTTPSVPA